MPEKISKSEHQYAGRDLRPGDRFDVDPEHVKLLEALGRIEPEEEIVEPAPRPRGRPARVKAA